MSAISMLIQPHRPVLGVSPATHVPGDDGACSTVEDWLTNKQVLRRFGACAFYMIVPGLILLGYLIVLGFAISWGGFQDI